MHIEAWDTVFVRARRADVHPVLRDLAGYERWWPGLRSTVVGEAVRLRHRPPRLLRGAHTVELQITRERPDRGLRLACRGDLVGEAERFDLDEVDGVTLHHLLRVDAWRRPQALLAAHRASVRAALTTLKDRLEQGRLPGAEPEPALVAHQARLIAARRREAEDGR